MNPGPRTLQPRSVNDQRKMQSFRLRPNRRSEKTFVEKETYENENQIFLPLYKCIGQYRQLIHKSFYQLKLV